MHVLSVNGLLKDARAAPMSIRFALPLLVIICTVSPMAGLSGVSATTWAYGQPLPFLDFYSSGGWSLWFQVWRIRLATDVIFWCVALGILALACIRLHKRFGEQFSVNRAFFGFIFGIGICLTQVACPLLCLIGDWLDISVIPFCDPMLIVSTFFAHMFAFDRWVTRICTLLVLFGCVLPASLIFARGVRIWRPWSGLAIAVLALAGFSGMIAYLL
jgi:hypothetical protein